MESLKVVSTMHTHMKESCKILCPPLFSLVLQKEAKEGKKDKDNEKEDEDAGS